MTRPLLLPNLSQFSSTGRWASLHLLPCLAVASLSRQECISWCSHRFAGNKHQSIRAKTKMHAAKLKIRRLVSTHLLFDLQLVYNWCQLRKNLVCLLVVLELSGNEIGEVAEWLRSVKDLTFVSFANDFKDTRFFCADNCRGYSHSS